MIHGAIRRLTILGAILVLPVVASAQEAVLGGTVTDSTGAVLPGVTITAVHQASGNRFTTVTDGGVYRIPVRIGAYHGIGTQESTTSQYLQPITAQTRTMQFGFRLTF
jgi:predicted methyltransferase